MGLVELITKGNGNLYNIYGEKIRAEPIGSPRVIDLSYIHTEMCDDSHACECDQAQAAICKNKPEGADAYAVFRLKHNGDARVQYYRIREE